MSFLYFLCHAGMPVVNGDSMIYAIFLSIRVYSHLSF